MTSKLRADYVWMDGAFVPWDDARIHVLNHTLHYGLGVFEGTRAYEQHGGGTAVFRLDDHLRRLRGSARIVQIDLPYDHDVLREASLELVARNGAPSCYLRHVAMIGAGVMGLHPQDNPTEVMILSWPWGAYLGKDGLENGVRCKISSFTRHHPNATMIKAKANGNYINSILAKREATGGGYDEAILLDTHGFVAEGSGQNIFLVRNGILKTPPLMSVLEGITRDTVIQLARERDLEVRESAITRDELYVSDEAFFSGTAAELTPIVAVDDRVIGDGRVGPVTRMLQETFFSLIRGGEPAYSSWLTEVPATAAAAEEVAAG